MKPDLQKQHVTRCHEMAAEWFKEHKAHCNELRYPALEPAVIDWRKNPDNWEYGIQAANGHQTTSGMNPLAREHPARQTCGTAGRGGKPDSLAV